MTAPIMVEKRKAIRLDGTLEISFSEVASDPPSDSRGKNISETGIRVPLLHFPVKGSLWAIEINCVQFKTSVRAIARVEWVVAVNKGKYPFEAGLMFLNLPEEDRAILHEYIARSAKKDGEAEIRWMD